MEDGRRVNVESLGSLQTNLRGSEHKCLTITVWLNYLIQKIIDFLQKQ